MPSLADHPVTRRWPALHPERLQLYSIPTPNGVKIGIALEEMGIAYEGHRLSFADNDQFTSEFLALNPNNKIPAILDPNGPDGQPLALFESGAILIYLAEKSGKFLPTEPVVRLQILQWLMWQMGGVGPMFGQMGFFHKFSGAAYEDKRPLERYRAESERLLTVLNGQLAGREYICGDYSIADMAVFPWVRTMLGHYEARDLIGWEQKPHAVAWYDRVAARPAVQRGVTVPVA